jgi:hypothetical protein
VCVVRTTACDYRSAADCAQVPGVPFIFHERCISHIGLLVNENNFIEISIWYNFYSG